MDPLLGTVIRGTFKFRLAGRREWTTGLISFNDASFHLAARATWNLGAGGHRDRESGLIKVNDALFPTRSFSSFCSHFLSSIISSFCLRRVSCLFCLSLCQSRWASSLLFGSTRKNSLSYKSIEEHKNLFPSLTVQKKLALVLHIYESVTSYLTDIYTEA